MYNLLEYSVCWWLLWTAVAQFVSATVQRYDSELSPTTKLTVTVRLSLAYAGFLLGGTYVGRPCSNLWMIVGLLRGLKPCLLPP